MILIFKILDAVALLFLGAASLQVLLSEKEVKMSYTIFALALYAMLGAAVLT